MLKKLLKYDFKAVIKYWWIAALSSVALSLIGGWCITIFTNEKELPPALYIVATLLMIVVVLGFSAFAILSTILIFSRFYKNFFTDEGYLTFTLPVKRSSLLNSKLIVSTVMSSLTGIIIFIDIAAMLWFGLLKDLITPEEKQEFKEIMAEGYSLMGGYIFVYLFEIISLLILLSVCSNLFMFICITIASIITKKAKVLTAIAIYYFASSAVSFFVQIFYLFGLTSIDAWLTNLADNRECPALALIMLSVILLLAIFCGLFYALQYWLLDRKLNLS